MLLAISVLTGPTLAADPTPPREPGILLAGKPTTRAIAGGEIHTFRIEGESDATLRVLVFEDGVDVALRSGDAAEVDSPLHGLGREGLVVRRLPVTIAVRAVEPGSSGEYTIELQGIAPGAVDALQLLEEADRAAAKAKDAATRTAAVARYDAAERALAKGGSADDRAYASLSRCELERRLGRREAAFADCQRARDAWSSIGRPQAAARADSRLGLILSELGRGAEAATAYRRALASLEASGDRRGRATASVNLGLLLHYQGDLDGALGFYREALAIYEPLGHVSAIANLRNNIGGIHFVRGEAREASAEFRRAAEMHRQVGNLEGEASARGNLALLQRDLGDLRASLATQTEVLGIRRKLVDRDGEARALQNCALVYLAVGEPEQASALLQDALRLRRQGQDRLGEMATLRVLAEAATALGDLDAAMRHLDASIAIAEAGGLRDAVAAAQMARGEALRQAGRLADARAAFASAAAEFAAIGNRPKRAEAMLGQARAALALRAAAEAETIAAEAQRLLGASEYLPLSARASVVRGRASQASGRLDDAAAAADQAIAAIESVRGRIGTPDLRASYGATVREAYELAIEVALALAPAADPGAAAKTLEIAEWSRARAFRELLSEPSFDEEGSASSKADALRRRFTSLSAELDASIVAANDGRDASRAARLGLELDVAAAELRRLDPAFASLHAPRRLRAHEVRALLDPGTVLLEYMVGEHASHVWIVTPAAVRVVELPARHELEPRIRRVLDGWSHRVQGDDVAADARWLSERLLPAGALDGARRIAVVADGPLELLPFAALPRAGGRRLLEEAELVMLPSASVLATQREAAASRVGNRAALVALIDPVFGRADPRAPACSAAACAEVPPPALERLAASGAEGRAALAQLPKGAARSVLEGLAANRDAVLGGSLAAHRIVHLATHGVVDFQHPWRTGLYLSRVGRDGAAIEGFLGLRELAGLRLDADLVVLSACDSALGREVRGEGPNGLARAFMNAGAERAIATLWRIPDASSARIFARFYEALLAEGSSPAAALRRAQLALIHDRRRSDPYHWAAYTMHGDWR